MTVTLNRGIRIATAGMLAACGIAAAVVSAGSAARVDRHDLDGRAATTLIPVPPQDRFADAPDGVDATITGPVSTAFRKQREQAGCDKAMWPNIPAVCYPD